jgi:aspartate aminotransferase
VLVETREQDGFCLSPEQLRNAISPRTRMLMLNSPSNPTGGVYPVATLQALADIAVEKDIIVLSDEIYDKLIYPGHQFRTFASFGEEVRKRTVIVNGVSKAYAMTGWRIGWTLAPDNVSAAINKLQSQQTSNPCSVSQYAALAALTGPQECVAEMCQEFVRRRDYVSERLQAIPGLSFAEPGGAFYVFFNVSSYFGKPLGGGAPVNNATDFCTALLECAHVALVSGDAFVRTRVRPTQLRRLHAPARPRPQCDPDISKRKIAHRAISLPPGNPTSDQSDSGTALAFAQSPSTCWKCVRRMSSLGDSP